MTRHTQFAEIDSPTPIPLVDVTSGEKFINKRGIVAIKDGVKAGGTGEFPKAKPDWLRVKAGLGQRFEETRQIVHNHNLSTVCEEAKCPNIGECWNAGTATIMLMGDVCTRACRFCAVNTGNPKGWLDLDEPDKVARSVQLMKLGYVVLTSVNRDDLDDGGAQHYADCVSAVKQSSPGVTVEVLTPDFQGQLPSVEKVLDAGVDVFAQNVETVERLTHPIRDPRAGYQQTLEVLRHAKSYRPDVLTKSSLMLGMGETSDELLEAMDDLTDAGVDILTLGQYLQPTVHHHPVDRYIDPAEFTRYRELGLEKGFLEVTSGALVRSSYRAEQVLSKNNIGLEG